MNLLSTLDKAGFLTAGSPRAFAGVAVYAVSAGTGVHAGCRRALIHLRATGGTSVAELTRATVGPDAVNAGTMFTVDTLAIIDVRHAVGAGVAYTCNETGS